MSGIYVQSTKNIYMYVSEQYNVNLDMTHTYIENMSIQNEFLLKITYTS